MATEEKKSDFPFVLRHLAGSFGRELQGKMDRLDQLVGRNHWLSVGSYKEAILRRLLADRLPRRFAVSTGFILGHREGKRVLSRQIDILIWDAQSHAPIFYDEEMVVVPFEAARAAIEVKSTLTTKSVGNAFANLASIEPFVSDVYVRPSTYLYRAAFFYQQGNKITLPGKLLDLLNKYYSVNLQERLRWWRQLSSPGVLPNRTLVFLDAVAVLGVGSLLFREWGIDRIATPAYPWFSETIELSAFTVFCTDLIECLVSDGKRFNLGYDRPGIADALAATTGQVNKSNTPFLLLGDIPGPVAKIGEMSLEDSASLLMNRYVPTSIQPDDAEEKEKDEEEDDEES